MCRLPGQALSPWLAGGLECNWGIWTFPSAAQRRGYIGSGNIFMAEVCVPQETNIEALLTIWGSDMEHLRAKLQCMDRWFDVGSSSWRARSEGKPH